MVPLITSMETSRWLCIKLTGHVQIFGEYHRPHRWGSQNIPKPNETDSQTNIDTEVVTATTSIGATPLWIAKRWKGLEVYKVVQPTSTGFFQGCNPVRPLYREGLGARPLQTVSGDEETLCGVLGGGRFQFPCVFSSHYIFLVPVRFHFGSTMGGARITWTCRLDHLNIRHLDTLHTFRVYPLGDRGAGTWGHGGTSKTSTFHHPFHL